MTGQILSRCWTRWLRFVSQIMKSNISTKIRILISICDIIALIFLDISKYATTRDTHNISIPHGRSRLSYEYNECMDVEKWTFPRVRNIPALPLFLNLSSQRNLKHYATEESLWCRALHTIFTYYRGKTLNFLKIFWRPRSTFHRACCIKNLRWGRHGGIYSSGH